MIRDAFIPYRTADDKRVTNIDMVVQNTASTTGDKMLCAHGDHFFQNPGARITSREKNSRRPSSMQKISTVLAPAGKEL